MMFSHAQSSSRWIPQRRKELTKTAKAFGIKVETGQFIHKRERAKLISAWQQGNVEHETRRKVDAICRAHGDPVSVLPEDYESLLTAGKYHDAKLGAHSCCEAFQDKLQEGRLKPETLAQVVSYSEEACEAAKPEAPKSSAIHLDSALSPNKETLHFQDPFTHRGAQDEVHNHGQFVASIENADPGKSIVRRIRRAHMVKVP